MYWKPSPNNIGVRIDNLNQNNARPLGSSMAEMAVQGLLEFWPCKSVNNPNFGLPICLELWACKCECQCTKWLRLLSTGHQTENQRYGCIVKVLFSKSSTFLVDIYEVKRSYLHLYIVESQF